MQRAYPLVSLVASAAVIGACSGADTHRKPGTDAGTDAPAETGGSGGKSTGGAGGGSGGKSSTGGASGSGGSAGSGGAAGSGGSAGSSGAAGSGGTAIIRVDASVDAAVEAAVPALVCSRLPAPDGGDGGLAQWRNWATHTCVACPVGNPLVCLDVGNNRESFDPVTKRLTVEVHPGVDEVVGGTASFTWDAIGADGGVITGTASAALTVNEDTLTADFTGQIPDTVYSLYDALLTLNDACGTQSVFGNYLGSGFNDGIVDDAGVKRINIHCER